MTMSSLPRMSRLVRDEGARTEKKAKDKTYRWTGQQPQPPQECERPHPWAHQRHTVSFYQQADPGFKTGILCDRRGTGRRGLTYLLQEARREVLVNRQVTLLLLTQARRNGRLLRDDRLD